MTRTGGLAQAQIEPATDVSRLAPVPRPSRLRPRRLPFDVLVSKIQVPIPEDGFVSRTALVNRLRANTAFPIVAVTAPAGYGKTTLLAQWAERDRRPFAWVTVDVRDAEPSVLLRHLAAALHGIEPLEPHVLDALARPQASIWAEIMPRLGAALRDFAQPPVVVLDDAHLLRSPESLEAIGVLADHLPSGAVLALAGRSSPRLPLHALRAHGKLFEIGVETLALTPREAQIVLRSAGETPALEDVVERVRDCEGWPLAIGRRMSVGEFFREEYLSRLRPDARRFLRRTAVLDEMCGGLCDAVLDLQGSARELRRVERAGLFLVPLDDDETWFRYHRLFREALLRELGEREPDLVRVLHRRAAEWYEQHGDLEAALRHADSAGDVQRVARILTAIALPLYHGGRAKLVEGWLARFDDPVLLERHPGLALRGSWIHALRGRGADARRWLASADAAIARRRPSVRSASLRAWSAAIRALLCDEGVPRMVADAESALAGLPRGSEARPPALVALGVGHALLGESEKADAILVEACAEAERLGAWDTQVLALAERSLLAARRDDVAAAEQLATEAHELIERSGLDGYATTALALAASARAALRHGRWSEARESLDRLEELESVGDQLPWLALQTRTQVAAAFVALRQSDTVSALLTEIEGLVRNHPHVGVLADEAEQLKAEAKAMHASDDRHAGLTAAELRLLPYLATHLSFREIGDELFVSRNTIKTQAIAVYRKLGVSSRSEAIARAAQLGLVTR